MHRDPEKEQVRRLQNRVLQYPIAVFSPSDAREARAYRRNPVVMRQVEDVEKLIRLVGRQKACKEAFNG